MSRIGLKPITIPAGVDVNVNGATVTVKGPNGTLSMDAHPNMTVSVEGSEIIVSRPNDAKEKQITSRFNPYTYPQYGCRCYRGIQEKP